ncbi:hypothetical protein [Aeromonas enterica]
MPVWLSSLLDAIHGPLSSPNARQEDTMKCYSGLSLLCLALLSGSSHAACDNKTALTLAKAFWREHRDFYYTEPDNIKDLLTPDFFTVLSSEARCNADGEACALDADPWINAQDGEVTDPISFSLVSHTVDSVTVGMTYLFALSDTQKEPQTVTFHFQKSGDSRCFLMDDFIPPGDNSLKQRLQRWQSQNHIGQQ